MAYPINLDHFVYFSSKFIIATSSNTSKDEGAYKSPGNRSFNTS